MKYILIVMQEANFASRTALVPAESFLAARGSEWQLLRAACCRETLEGYTIDRVVWREFEWEGCVGHEITGPFHALLGALGICCEYDNCIADQRDAEWCAGALRGLGGGFNHVLNYVQLLQLTSYQGKLVEIVDSALILERDLGAQYHKPPVDTVEQLREFYESNKEN